MVILVQFQIILVAAGIMHMIEGRHQINVQDKHYPNKPESLIFILAAVLNISAPSLNFCLIGMINMEDIV